MIYLVCGVMVCILSMAGVYTSSMDLIWCFIGFAIGIYLIVKGKKKIGFIKQKWTGQASYLESLNIVGGQSQFSKGYRTLNTDK